MAVSQLTVPELSAGRQARQARDPRPQTGPWPGHWDRAEPLTATAIRGPYRRQPQVRLRDIISLGGDPGGLVPFIQLSFRYSGSSTWSRGIFKSNNNKNSNNHS